MSLGVRFCTHGDCELSGSTGDVGLQLCKLNPIVREAMLRFTHQEVPHAAAVFVEDYHERDNGVLFISATIWVERESQKPIVIGKQGQRLKQIGTAARAELERFIEGKVYLELWVKVQPQWRDRDGRLRELGF